MTNLDDHPLLDDVPAIRSLIRVENHSQSTKEAWCAKGSKGPILSSSLLKAILACLPLAPFPVGRPSKSRSNLERGGCFHQLAHDRINILTPSFEHVFELDQNIIWNDLLTTFDIPNVTTLKNKCLSSIAAKFQGFKTKLTSRYIFGGQFTPEGRQDILTTTIERPEHPGRVRVVGRSRKGSCSAPAVHGDDMDDASPCLLYFLDGIGTMLVAHGTVFNATTVVHDEIFTMAHAFQSFIAGPKHLVGSVSDHPQLCDIIGDEPMKVEYDANVFGRGSEVPVYLHSQDVRELASGREELNITLIQLWMMYMFGVNNNLGYNDVYGFIDPQVIHEANDFDDITTYLTSRFGSGKEIYFIRYIYGGLIAFFVPSFA
ncbi:hypothetical protein LR48_Vigan07g207900 [Vigna angularis]|uniref:Uncharacterized protein n=1 Tax=Phaseolus angularis TaxID=3914 RepID=A0A0L9UZT4_PHAAN|nr:hypothetical protein LR48_Vigan07g207900 [Vigna angularis]